MISKFYINENVKAYVRFFERDIFHISIRAQRRRKKVVKEMK